MKYNAVKVGDVVSFQNGYTFKSNEFQSKGKYSIVKIRELKDGLVRFFEDSAKISDVDEEIVKKYKVEYGDVLFALTGDPVNKNNPLSWVGRVSLYTNSKISLLNQRVCKAIFSDKIDSYFFYYFFRLFDNFYSLAAKATGSASQANISTKTIEDSIILLPDLQTQKQISSILCALDRKIRLNEEINCNLCLFLLLIIMQFLIRLFRHPSAWVGAHHEA